MLMKVARRNRDSLQRTQARSLEPAPWYQIWQHQDLNYALVFPSLDWFKSGTRHDTCCFACNDVVMPTNYSIENRQGAISLGFGHSVARLQAVPNKVLTCNLVPGDSCHGGWAAFNVGAHVCVEVYATYLFGVLAELHARTHSGPAIGLPQFVDEVPEPFEKDFVKWIVLGKLDEVLS